LLIFFADMEKVVRILDAATRVDREEECWTQGSFLFFFVLFLFFFVLFCSYWFFLVPIGSYWFLLIFISNAATRVDKEGEC